MHHRNGFFWMLVVSWVTLFNLGHLVTASADSDDRVYAVNRLLHNGIAYVPDNITLAQTQVNVRWMQARNINAFHQITQWIFLDDVSDPELFQFHNSSWLEHRLINYCQAGSATSCEVQGYTLRAEEVDHNQRLSPEEQKWLKETPWHEWPLTDTGKLAPLNPTYGDVFLFRAKELSGNLHRWALSIHRWAGYTKWYIGSHETRPYPQRAHGMHVGAEVFVSKAFDGEIWRTWYWPRYTVNGGSDSTLQEFPESCSEADSPPDHWLDLLPDWYCTDLNAPLDAYHTKQCPDHQSSNCN